MEASDIVKLFTDEVPCKTDFKNTSHGDMDFREIFFVTLQNNRKIIIKVAASGFADEEHLVLWERIASEYRKLGYYCPLYIRALDGSFPHVSYKGKDCIAWGEEFSIYRSADELIKDKFKDTHLMKDGWFTFLEDAALMDAKVASAHFDYTEFPSAYCMFEIFDPADECDETTEDALKWLDVAKKLPERFKPQVERIWNNWLGARAELEKIYHKLPTSVFQADINPTNVLLDEEGHFKGVYDFNIGGKEVYINYLFRQMPYVSTWDDTLEVGDNFLNRITHGLSISRKAYSFSELEKEAAPLLYKCIRPLWWYASDELTEAGSDEEKINKLLERIEYEQNRVIDFERFM